MIVECTSADPCLPAHGSYCEVARFGLRRKREDGVTHTFARTFLTVGFAIRHDVYEINYDTYNGSRLQIP